MNAGHMEYCASEDWRRLVHETILPEALRGVELGDDAVEIGPGPGFTTDVLRTVTAHLTAVELDEGLAAALAARLAGGNVEVVVGDATALDFPSGRFTGAASFHMLHHIAPARAQDRALAELARVLRPGGALVAADGTYSEGSAAFHEGDTYNPVDPGDLPRRLEAAGFGEVRVRTYDLGWVVTARSDSPGQGPP
jgi:SAM-dependent methyltransferase